MPEPSGAAVARSVLAGQRRPVLVATALLMAWQGCESLVPVAIGLVIDRAVLPGSVPALLVSVVGLVLLFGVLSSSFRFGSRAALRANRLASHALRVDLAGVVLDPARRTDRGRQAGETVQIAGVDADRVARLCSILPFVVGSVTSLAVAAVVLLRISVLLGVVVLVGTPLLLVAMNLLGAPLARRSAREQEQAAAAGALAGDLVAGLRVLRGFGGEPAAARRYAGASEDSRRATVRAAGSQAGYEGVTLLLTLLFLALVTLVAGRLAASGRISVGDLVAAVGLAQFLLGPLAMFSHAGTVLARARASARRVASVLGASRLPAATALSAEPHLRLPEAGLEVRPGEMVGVVADERAGDALVRLLGGEDGYEGVYLGAVALDTVDPAQARAGVVVCHHAAGLFSGSVEDNVGDGPLRDDALAAAAADEVVTTLPDGLASEVGERGRHLSGGQRQRVVLARALALDAPVLVLHDPTTAVDSVTEQQIASGLARVRTGRTTVVVATSPALLDVCDRVVVPGPDPLQGRHHDLLATSAAYRDLVLR